MILTSLVLLALLPTVKRVQGSISTQRCPLWTLRTAGRCIPLHLLDGNDFELGDRKTLMAKCNCMPFYKCRLQDVMALRIKSCRETEVCCKKGQPMEVACGWSQGGEGATEAQYGEFPWMVAILNVGAGENWTREDSVGGGAIVHPRVVLTAAHKLQGKTAEMLKCRAGEWARTAPEPLLPQDRLVRDLLTHPDYERRYLANDVSLLRLTQPFDLSVGPARALCLGRGPPPRPDRCVATGWGQRQYDSDYADILKKVVASLVPRGVCGRALEAADTARRRRRGRVSPHATLHATPHATLHATLRCAGGLLGQDTCTGDGGSPLVCEIQKESATRVRYAAYGLAAWGVGCGARGAPGVYVDVAKLHDWIVATLKTII